MEYVWRYDAQRSAYIGGCSDCGFMACQLTDEAMIRFQPGMLGFQRFPDLVLHYRTQGYYEWVQHAYRIHRYVVALTLS